MVLLWVIFIGFVVGVVAKLVHPGSDPGGFLVTSAIGIGGSIIATYLGHALGLYAPGRPAGFIGAVIGAVLLLTAYRAVRS